MCGIAGICQLKEPKPISLDLVKKMTARLSHRGPDETGIYLDDWAALGHTRLSIIDLSSGCQPISNEDQTLWIIFNGEVFNYIELREELLAKGHRFTTTSDTEVILHIYEDYGPACLEFLNGQFVFVIWDSVKKELFIARDRIGIRPLFYSIQNDHLVFASEIKSILADPDFPREVDPIAIDQVFTFWTTLFDRTMFQGIHELPAGHYLRVSQGNVQVKPYWQIPFCPSQERLDWSPDRLAEEILALMRNACEIRLRADVPVGSYLSGGLDSSGITTLIRHHFTNPLRTFGIQFADERFDESEYQKLMVSELKTDHSYIHVTDQDISAHLPEVVWACEKPLLRTAPVPMYLLSKLVRESGFKVVLSGEGADEIFGGYNIYREAKVRKFWSKNPKSPMRSQLINKLYPYIFKDNRMNPFTQLFFSQGLDSGDDPLFSHKIRWQNTGRIKALFSADLQHAIGNYSGYDEVRDHLPAEFTQWDTLAKAQYLEMSIFLTNYLLSSQGDRVGMANSIETRHPYLDYRLIEFLGKVPSTWKILGLNEKHILKKIYSPILPPKISQRPKQPFRAPISKYLLTLARQTASDTLLQNTKIFDPEKVQKFFQKIENSTQSSETDNMALTGVITAQLFHSQFIDHFSPAVPHKDNIHIMIDRRTGT